MAKPVDPRVITLLEQAEFSRHDLDGLVVYHNRAESSRQMARLCFVAQYDTPKEAAEAELLSGFYLRAAERGSEHYPTKDSLTRAFLGARTALPDINLERRRDMLFFAIDLSVPAGEKGKPSLEHSLSLANIMLNSPLVRTPDEGPAIMELAREGSIRIIEDAVQDHSERATRLYSERYFPAIYPLDTGGELDILRKAGLSDIVDAYEGFLSRSVPVALISGDSPVEEIAVPLSGFAAGQAPKGEESVLSQPEVLQMPAAGEPVFEHGPSEQMQFLRCYPLAEVPDSMRDRAALAVVNTILGGGWTGRLMQVIREKHHLVYGISSAYQRFMNSIILKTEHDPALYKKISQLTQGIVNEIASGRFTNNEFEAVQDQMLEQMLVSSQGGLATCDQPSFRIDRASDRFISKVAELSLAEAYRLVASLSPEEGRRACRRYLGPSESQIFTYSDRGEGR